MVHQSDIHNVVQHVPILAEHHNIQEEEKNVTAVKLAADALPRAAVAAVKLAAALAENK